MLLLWGPDKIIAAPANTVDSMFVHMQRTGLIHKSNKESIPLKPPSSTSHLPVVIYVYLLLSLRIPF